MRLNALGEFGVIAALGQLVSRPSPSLLVGVGDDAAVWASSQGAEIATTDLLLEGIHFRLDTTSWYDLGWKALAVNLSDIAAMGGQPRYALVGLGLPPNTEFAMIQDFYRGATAIGDRFGTIIIGGDTVRSDAKTVVSVSLIGSASVIEGNVRWLRRDAARVGDIIAVTGTLGASAGGLELLLHHAILPAEVTESLGAAHATPVPRVPEAHVLLAMGVEAAMDISDGLVGDLVKLCTASGVAGVLDPAKVPLSNALRTAFPERARSLALYGGEDYELLFAVRPELFGGVADRLRDMGLAPATAIGQISSGPSGRVWLLDAAGHRTNPRHGGYDAFAASCQG